MPQAYAVRETPGNRSLSSEMDFVASGSYVRFFFIKLSPPVNEGRKEGGILTGLQAR